MSRPRLDQQHLTDRLRTPLPIRDYVREHIQAFPELRSEEDLKLKVLLPYLEDLGYSRSDMRFENAIDVQVGTRRTLVKSDIEIFVNGRVQLVIDAKNPRQILTDRDLLQVASYAKLVSTPPALYAVATNGLDCPTTNTLTGSVSDRIPSKAELLRDVDRLSKRALSEVELREVRSVLLTLLNPDDLHKIINRSKEIIEKRGLIRSDQSFREMTKILLVKMSEERRARYGEAQNRFSVEYLSASARANEVQELRIFARLFNEAKQRYPDIYAERDEELRIQDNECIVEVVRLLEPWSFLGTGDDIKGAVYEIFLKSTLRGDFDQYFTPRQIVDFMVKIADPHMGQTILDPACGSGGFLIQAFKHVNRQILSSDLSEVEINTRFRELTERCLWGNEADYDLHVLAKINLIMHGDGYNHITHGDTLQKSDIPRDFFDYILTNPPFTIRYEFAETLAKYELGIGKESEELDILFVEKCLDALRAGGDLFIVLPEGLLNNARYKYFREWLLQRSFLLASISLPEGAFIPFGESVSKTCILGLRKKNLQHPHADRPEHVFLGTAREIGYEAGKKIYKPTSENDLLEFARNAKQLFSEVLVTSNGGECGWLNQALVIPDRIDSSFLLNTLDRSKLRERFHRLEPLSKICRIENENVTPKPDQTYAYLEVPDITPGTGVVSNIRRIRGNAIKSAMHAFRGGDVLLTRINPRLSRITIIPEDVKDGLVSKEVFRLVLLNDGPIVDKYVLYSVLQSEHVRNQIVRLATGSSSSRARVQEDDLLHDVYVPIPEERTQIEISDTIRPLLSKHWIASQDLLTAIERAHTLLGSDFRKDDARTV